jgi:hypothetical protein
VDRLTYIIIQQLYMSEATKIVEYFFRCGLSSDAKLDAKRQTVPDGLKFFSTSELYDGAGQLLRNVESLGIIE